jgi:hypothetical protein
VDFEACLEAIEAMSAQLVEVRVWGPETPSHSVASFSGILQRMGEVELPPGAPEEAIGERAVTFVIGGGSAYLNLWASRFVDAEMWKHPPDWLEVRTHDGRVVLGPKRPAWAD